MKTDKILLGTDTVSGIHPKILNAITIASNEKTLPYGNDIFTKECKSIISKIFEKDDLDIIPMMSGTASNSLAPPPSFALMGVFYVILKHILIKMREEPRNFFSCGEN